MTLPCLLGGMSNDEGGTSNGKGLIAFRESLIAGAVIRMRSLRRRYVLNDLR